MSIPSLTHLSAPTSCHRPVDTPPAFNRATQRSSAATAVPRGRALFWQGEQQPYRIDVVQGVVRAVRLLEDGDRQILAFYWPGDTVYPSQSACQHYTAEAVTNCRVHCQAVASPCHQPEPCGVQQVLAATLNLISTMSKKTTQQRIAGFLLAIRPHLPHDPRHHALHIMIPRADIADHLGTSLETVCRTLADFRNRGLIDLPNRKTIRFVNIARLTALASN